MIWVHILELKSDKHDSDVVVQCLELSCAVPLADIECAKSYAKMAESAKALASQQVSERRTPSDFVQEENVRGPARGHLDFFQFQEFMPFRETYVAAFKNDIEYSQLVLQTAAVLQSNKFMQVRARTRDARLTESGGENKRLEKCFCGYLFVLIFFLLLLFSLFSPERMNWTD